MIQRTVWMMDKLPVGYMLYRIVHRGLYSSFKSVIRQFSDS
jgi:hypothetical protein